MLNVFELSGAIGAVAGIGSIAALRYKPKAKPHIDWFTNEALYDDRLRELERQREEAITEASSPLELDKIQIRYDDLVNRTRLRKKAK